MVHELIVNVTLLVSLIPIYSLLNPRIRKGDLLSKVLTGLLFGSIAIIGMLVPYHYSPGIVYDGRSIVMVMAGLFGGGTVGLLSAVIAVAFRTFLGGNGMWAGISTIISTMLLGLFFRRLIKNHPSKLSIPALYGIGVGAHILMLACQLLIIPWPTGPQIIGNIWPSVLLIFPLATVLMGIMLRREDRYLEAIDYITINQSRNKAVLQSAQDGYWRIDLQGYLLEVNQAYCTMTGYTEQELLNKSVSDMEAYEDQNGVAAHIQKVLEKKYDRFESFQTRKNGEVFPVEVSFQYLPEQGDYLFAFIRDLTEIRKMDEEIRKKHYLLEESQHIAHLGSWEYDLLSDTLIWSDEVYQIFGIQPDEFDGAIEGFLDLLHPDDRAVVYDVFMDAVNDHKESFEIEHRLIRKCDGETRTVKEKSRLIMDAEGNVVLTIGTVLDITDLTNTLRELRSLSKRYEAILHTIPDIIAEVNNEKEYVWVNKAGADFFGEDVIGKNAEVYFLGKQDTLTQVQPLFNGRSDTIDVESWQMRKDGEKRLLSWRCCTLRNADGNVIGTLASARDITEAMRDKQEVIKLNRELEQRVQSRTAELEAANEELKIFTYSVSHDLRGPLRAINGFTEILGRRHRASLDSEGQEYLGYVIDASEQMGLLIDDLLGYARLGSSAVQNTEINSQEIFDQVKQMLSTAIEKTQAELTLPENCPHFKGDPILLKHIIYNLIDNALKFQFPDRHPKVVVTCEKTRGKMSLKVTDNGIGMASQYLEKIFAPFQRLHSQDEYPGTGMGLAMVKKSAELMGGQVWVESEIGNGSTFGVSLPVTQKEN